MAGSGDGVADLLVSREGVSNVLLSTGSPGSCGMEVCGELTRIHPADELGTIAVSLSRTPDECVGYYRDIIGGLPASLSIVAYGDDWSAETMTEKAYNLRPDGGPRGSSGISVSHASDITSIGVRVTESLQELATREDVAGTSLCFRSLSALLGHVDVKTAYKFLDVLTGQLQSHGVFAHYHVDPFGTENGDVDQLTHLFDAIVECSEDGEISHRTRV